MLIKFAIYLCCDLCPETDGCLLGSIKDLQLGKDIFRSFVWRSCLFLYAVFAYSSVSVILEPTFIARPVQE